MRIVKAVGILGIGFIMTFMLFPWLDSLKDEYHPTEIVLCDQNNTGDTTQVAISNNDYALQKFVAGSAYKVYCVKLKLWLEGTGAGTLELRIYHADDDGEPTGTTLASGTIASSVMSSTAPGDWETVLMMPQTALVTGSAYVIQLSYDPEGDEWVNWRINPDSLGDFAYSTNAGDSWTHGSLPGS